VQQGLPTLITVAGAFTIAALVSAVCGLVCCHLRWRFVQMGAEKSVQEASVLMGRISDQIADLPLNKYDVTQL